MADKRIPWLQDIHSGGRDTDGVAGGGGPPDDGDMEQRVARLEADLADLKADVREIRGDVKAISVAVAEVKGRIDSMPTTWTLFVANVGLLVASIGAVAAVFALLDR